jgi:hypothetical protein
VLGSVVGYFFCIISVFTTVMALMTLLAGVLDNSTFAKNFRHYPQPIMEHPRPIIERTVTPVPNQDPHQAPNPEPHHIQVALGTAPKDLSGPDKTTNDSRAASAKADAKNRTPERRPRPERFAHHREPKVLARERQNYVGHGYAMSLGYSGYSPGLDSQR